MNTVVETDQTPRYVPKVVMTTRHGRRPVVTVIAHPPNSHPAKCPLYQSCTAVELITDVGQSRWYGVERAYINSELRMVVVGFPARFEEMQAWEVCKHPIK